MLIYDVVVLTAPHCVVVRLNSQTDIFFYFLFLLLSHQQCLPSKLCCNHYKNI